MLELGSCAVEGEILLKKLYDTQYCTVARGPHEERRSTPGAKLKGKGVRHQHG